MKVKHKMTKDLADAGHMRQSWTFELPEGFLMMGGSERMQQETNTRDGNVSEPVC